MQCPYCGSQHPDGARFCPAAGKALLTQASTCERCGASLPLEAHFCPVCGAIVRPKRAQWITRPRAFFVGLVIIVLLVLVFGVGTLARNRHDLASPSVRFTRTIALTETKVAGHQVPEADFENPTPTRTRMVTPTPTRRITRTPTITPTEDSWIACQGSYPSRLHIGNRAYISSTPFLANRVRSKPGLSSEIIGRIQSGEYLKILDGPACANEWVWWYIRAEKDSLLGWTAEGDSENYWLMPAP